MLLLFFFEFKKKIRERFTPLDSRGNTFAFFFCLAFGSYISVYALSALTGVSAN